LIQIIAGINKSMGSKNEIPPNMAKEHRQSAIEICRVVDYHLQEVQDGAGSLILLFPLRLAWQALDGNKTIEGAWLFKVSTDVKHGFRGRWRMTAHMLTENWLEEPGF